MGLNKRTIGEHYEQFARQFLEQQGLKFIAQNQHYKTGELDLIMRQNACIVFVEVKFRKNTSFGGAAYSISKQKKRCLLQTAYLWLQRHNYSTTQTQYRFDAIIIEGKISNTHWFQNILVEG